MPKQDRRKGRIAHVGKKRQITTVDDLLTEDDVAAVLEELNRLKKDTSRIIAIVIDREGMARLRYTPFTIAELVYEFEASKNDVLQYDGEDEADE